MGKSRLLPRPLLAAVIGTTVASSAFARASRANTNLLTVTGSSCTVTAS